MKSFKFGAALVLTFLSFPAGAHLPFDDLNEKVLREPNPFSFIVFNPDVDLQPEDFFIEGRKGEWVPDSLQWVRVGNGKDEVGILIPRARYRENGVETEVALTQVGQKNRLRFKPRSTLQNHVFFDSSCSPFRPQLLNARIQKSWVMVSCHRVHVTNESGSKPVMLASVLWEQESKGGFQQVNFDSEKSTHLFSNPDQPKGDTFELEMKVAPRFKHLGLSAGIGPYSSRNILKPFLTLYASYFFNDALKVASFGALPIRANPEIDWGGYLVLEQFRGVDERISLNFLLGAHLLSYPGATGERFNRVSAPQGIELTFRDLFAENLHFVMGGFFYPLINERSYLNAWVRYGTQQLFVELNFIEWQEPKPYFYSKSFGVSVGFPLFRAL